MTLQLCIVRHSEDEDVVKRHSELYDVDARNDPFLAEYGRARSLLFGSDWRRGLDEMEGLAHRGSLMSMLFVADAMRVPWGYEQDLPEAEAWFRVAVESGSARGLFGLGLTHLQMGRFSDAIQDLEAAIARDFPPAYNALAGMHFRGDGVPIDRQRALGLWRRGASLGHLGAKRDLIHELIHGRYGLLGRVEGILKVLPLAIEIVRIRNANANVYTDRLR